MASISEIVSELESTKNQLEAAKTASDGAGEQTAEMITQAEGMELEDTAEGLRTLKTGIEQFGEQIIALASGVDELVSAAEALRNNSSS
jgi:prefoldin subunit 5